MHPRTLPFTAILAAATLTGCASSRMSPVTSDTSPAAVRADGSAYAMVRSSSGQDVGTVRFASTDAGVHITGTLTGLPPGLRGMHLHAVGRCDAPDFTTAQGHFNPANAQHGLSNPSGPHAGDLPMLEVQPDGRAVLDFRTSRATLDPSSGRGLLDSDGTAIVIHAAQDDQRSDPGGNSGARIACGVLARAH
ncbi:MAG: superoxide dismutase family protein [Gemmatimonadaceae bacterium]